MNLVPCNLHRNVFFNTSNLKIGTHRAVKYNPVYSLPLNNKMKDSKYSAVCPYINKGVFNLSSGMPGMYYKPEAKNYANKYNTYCTFKKALKSLLGEEAPMFQKLTFRGYYTKIFVGPGFILDWQDNFLLVLCSNKMKPYTISRDGRNWVDRTKTLRLYISTDFSHNISNRYRSFYKKLEKEYISVAISNNIEIVYLSSKQIEDKLFQTNVKIKVKNIDSIQKLGEDLIKKRFPTPTQGEHSHHYSRHKYLRILPNGEYLKYHRYDGKEYIYPVQLNNIN